MTYFGLDPTHVPLSKIRYDIGLHIPCAIVRKILHFLRQCIERFNDNNEAHAFLRTCRETIFTQINSRMEKHVNELMVIIQKCFI